MNTERRIFKPFAQYEDFELPAKPEVSRKVGTPAHDPKATAEAIILAGKKRRNEVVEDLRPPIGSLGRAILDAAAKARGEVVK